MRCAACPQVEHHRGEAQPGKDRGQNHLPALPGDVSGRSAGFEGDHAVSADGQLCPNIRDRHSARGMCELSLRAAHALST